jgi:alpha-galactosidase
VKKMVLIGAGSAMFTQGLVSDLIRHSQGRKWHLALVDTDPGTLDSIAKLCEKMIEAKQADIQLSYSTDRREVLAEADYVVTTIGVGGRRAWEQDVFIPRKYGVFQPVGDTAMPGGISRAMRMIPALIEITRDVMRCCPKAYFFNYSNPMTANCRAISKTTGFPVIGLCHGVHDTQNSLADFAGIDRRRFSSYAVGINHLTFLYKFFNDGKDAYPLLMERYETLQKEGVDFRHVGTTFAEPEAELPAIRDPFTWSFMEWYGVYVAPGDRHITEFFPERFPEGSYYGKTFGVDAYSFEKVIAYGDQIYDQVFELAQSHEPLPATFFDKFVGEHEQLMEIIDSIETDSRKTFSVNMPNRGAVPNLPAEAVLELPAVATAAGFAPLQMRDFPDVLCQLLAKPIAIAELTVEAALTGDRNLFVEAILAGGYLNDRNAVKQMTDELIQAHHDFLPQFQ